MKQLFTTLVVAVMLWGSGVYAQFCTPTYSTGTTSGDSIVSISVGTLVGNYPGDPAGYNDYTDSVVTQLTAAQTYTATIVNNPDWTSGVTLYLDYDNNQVFDVATETAGSVLIPGGGTGTITFQIPANATQDTIVMRMVQNFNGIPTDPCGSFTFGETEDYSIEILPPPSDNIAVNGILPLDPLCDIFSGGAPISIEFNNGGANPADTIPFAYTINFGTPVLDTLFTPALPSGQSAVFTFSTLAQLPLPQTFYTIQAWTTYPPDAISSDDTFTQTILTPNLLVAPFTEDFETFTTGNPGTLNNGWTTDPVTGFRWQVDDLGTGSGNTGPSDDHTLNGQIYMYTEASTGGTGDSASLFSPCIDLDTASAPRLSFWYHMHGAAMGDLEVYVNAAGSSTNVWSISGQQQADETSDWLEAIVDLTAFANQIVQIEFRGKRGTAFTSDMAIDDIQIYNPAPIDMGAIAVVSPTGQACFGPAETIVVEIQNLGTDSIDYAVNNVTVNVDITGPIPATFSTTLTSGGLGVLATQLVTVTTNADLSTSGIYDFSAYTAVVGDPNAFNDSTIGQAESLPVVGTFLEDFETFTVGLPGTLNNGWTTTPATGYRWQVDNFGTGSFGTGPADDHTVNGSIYMYTEASSGFTGDSASLFSPCVDLSSLQSPRMSFWYHMFGAGMGTLEVYVNSGGASTLVWSLSGQQQSSEVEPWLEAIVNLSAFAGQTVQIEFRGIRGTALTSDMAVDDVNLFDPPPIDVLAGDITSPLANCTYTAAEQVCMEIVNFGTDTLDNVIVSFAVDAGPFGTPENTGLTILPGDTASYCFIATADLSVIGPHTITAVATQLAPADTVPGNDTTSYDLINFGPAIASYTYFEDFESGPNGWISGSLNGTNTWAFGTPAKPTIIGAASGDSAWVTGGLTGSYPNGEGSFVQGPCFDFSSLILPRISVDIWVESETFFDGVQLQASTDGGVTWSPVGAQGDLTNWYNSTAFAMTNYSSSNAIWAGRNGTGTNGWITADHALDGLGGIGSVNLRFVFATDGSVTDDGFAFDNVVIYETPPFDANMISLETPFTDCALGDSNIVTVMYSNEGSQSFSNASLSYQINAGTIVTETDTQTLAVGDTALFSFVAPADLSTPGVYFFDTWVVLTGDTVNGNDTLFGAQVEHKAAISTFPWTENFDDQTLWPPVNTFNAGIPVILLPNGWENVQGEAPQDWAPRNIATGSGNGPFVDHTTGSGTFFYVEDSAPYNNDSVIVTTPCFDVTGMNSPKFGFWYHSNNSNPGVNDNSLHVDVLYNGDLILDVIPPIGHVGDIWTLQEIDMSPYMGIFSVRFRVDNNNGTFTHDIGIDDINLVDVLPQDAGIATIFSPASSCDLTNNEDLIVALTNFGTDSVFGVDVNYSLNNGPASTVAFTDTLLPVTAAPNNFIPFIIPGVDFSVPGDYTVTVWTSNLTGDINFFNDTFEVVITSVPTVVAYPYFEDFENGTGGWVAEGLFSTWVLGAPGGGLIDTAFSGVNAWITGDSTNYGTNENSAVVGPCFDFTNLTVPVVKFAINYNTFFGDGAVLQSSIDNGGTWQNVGALNDPVNWFNNGFLGGNPGGSPVGWGGSTNGQWLVAEHDLTGLGGEPSVRLRVAFADNGFGGPDGFAFDDVLIYDKPTADVGVLDFINPSAFTCSEDSTLIEVQITNFGTQPQFDIPINVQIVGPTPSGPILFTYTDTLQPGDTTNVVVGSFDTNAGGFFDLTSFTTLTGDSTLFNDTADVYTIEVGLTAGAPTVFSDSVCATDSATFELIANTTIGTIQWYDSVGGQVIATGDTFNTPFLTSSTTYYAVASESQNFGGFTPVDNTIGGGGNYNFFADGLVFDAFTDFELKTVKVYPSGPGILTVNLLDNTGANVDSKSFNFGGTVSDTVLTLDFIVETGVDYQLNLAGSTVPFCFRNNSGATFPYTQPGIVSLTNTINGLGVSSGFYYFFYDWVVSSLGCPSPAVPVEAVILDPVAVDLGADGTVCEGFVLDASDPAIVSYIWNNDPNVNTPTITADTSGQYTVDVVNGDGCTGADTVILIVNPNPVVNLGADATECGSYVLDAGNPGASYQWSDPDSTGQTFTATTTGTYFVTVTSLGCFSSDTVDVMINALPMVNLGPDYEGCLPLQLDAGPDGSIYDWSTGDNTQEVTVIPPMMGSDTITVDVESPEGCVSTDEIVISAGVAPTVDLGEDQDVCDSTNLGQSPDPGFTYTWSNGDTTAMTSATATDEYILTVVDNVGCEASDTVNVNVTLTPVADATFNNPGFDFTVDFVNLSNVTGSGATYAWNFGDGGSSTDENPTYTYTLSGTWPVTLIVTNSCGADTVEFNVGSVSINNDAFTQAISVYPNPTRGIFYIGSDDLTANELSIEVTDARGRRVFMKVLDNVFGGFNQSVDLTAAAEGVYVIKVSDGERTAIKRIVRE